MSENRSFCHHCGTLVDVEVGCPRCQLERGLGDTRALVDSDALAEREELERRFPGYEVGDVLGRGGMGVVYRGEHRRLGRPVAIKVLSRELRAQPGFAERFEREARTLARLSHPGLVAVHDYGVAGDLCVLFLEFVDGANLRELMDGGLTPEQSLDVVRQVCDALEYAHGEGVVHRDIKPENLLVDGNGRVKLADFGLARLVGDLAGPRLTWTRQVMGTPHYMAPEQARAGTDVDHRADVFALGVLFYELLTGALPVGTFRPPSEVASSDPRLDGIVRRAMEQAPDARYPDVRALKRDLDGVARELPAPLPRSPAPARSPAVRTFAVEGIGVPALSLLGLLSMVLPWAYAARGDETEYLFVFESLLALGVAFGFLLPLCVWDTFHYIIGTAREKGRPETASRHWPGMQNLSDLVGGGVAIATVTLFVQRVDRQVGHDFTYLFGVTLICAWALVLFALVRVALVGGRLARTLAWKVAMPRAVAAALVNGVPVLGVGGALLSLPLQWVPPGTFVGAPSGRGIGFEDAMALGATASMVAGAVFSWTLARASAFRLAGVAATIGGGVAFVIVTARLPPHLWNTPPGPMVCGVAALFLVLVGAMLVLFAPMRSPQR